LAVTKFVLVGYGNIGKRHAELLTNMEQADLTAVIDIDTTKKQEVEERLNAVFFSHMADCFQAGIEADVVIIATPNGEHYQQASQALEQGYHVLVEKPITLSQETCSALIEQAESYDRKVFCVLQNRFSPPARWLKSVVKQGKLGQIYLVDIHCFWNRDERYYTQSAWRGDLHLDGGTLFTQFSHFIDLLLWVFGEVQHSSGCFYNFSHRESIDFEDSGLLNLTMQNGARVVFHYSTAVWDKNMESSITVIGEKGSLKIGGQYMDSIEHCHIQDYEQPDIPSVNPPNDYGHFQGSAANHHYVLENIIKALHGVPYELAHPAEACKSIALIEAVYQYR